MKMILLVVIFCCYVKRKYMMSQDIALPDDLYRFCPLSSFCENEPDKSSKSSENESILTMPCCEECSCKQECGRKRNCCRYEHDLYRLEETLETVCQQLTTLSQRETENRMPFYHIIDKCSNRSQTCKWRFFPVYSRESGMLYYNPKCAGCHGQNDTDLIEFRPLITCRYMTYMSYLSAISSITNGSSVSNCYMHFIPPDNIDLSTERCYPRLKRDCDPNKINSELNAELCNAFNATFHYMDRAQYGNVYCFLCDIGQSVGKVLNTWNEKYVKCPREEFEKMAGRFSFAILFDSSSFDKSEGSTTDRRHVDLPVWCDASDNKEACRAVHCPEGRVHSDGVCKTLGDKWYFRSARINIKLTSPTGYQTVPTSKLLSINTYDPMKSPTSTYSLERPGFENWDVILLYNDIDNVTVSYFVAMLKFKYTTLSPNKFVDMTQRSLNRHWVLYLQGSVYVLKPEIHKYIRYEQFTVNDKIQYFPEWQMYPDANPDDLDRVAEVIKLVTTGNVNENVRSLDEFFITKLFFCNLVELSEEEKVFNRITVKTSLYRMYLASQERYLGDGEFARVSVDYDNQTIRVCLYELAKGEGYSKMATIMTLTYHFMICVTLMMASGII